MDWLIWIVGLISLTYVLVRFNLSLWYTIGTLHFTFFFKEHEAAKQICLIPILGQLKALKMTFHSLRLLFDKKYKQQMISMIQKENAIHFVLEQIAVLASHRSKK